MYWSKKVVLITGASAGLGYSIAEAFCRAGASVVVNGRDAARVDAAVEKLSADFPEVTVRGFVADVTTDEGVDALMADVKQHGGLDALVNNVGVSARGKVLDVTVEQFRNLLEINFFTAVRCTRAAMPLLKQSGGHVICIGSLASKTASRFLGGYAASKFALAAYCQQLRLETAEDGVHVLLVCPGPIARADAGTRYAAQSGHLPAEAAKPGGGVKLKGIPPERIAARILSACERRKPEIVMPGRARLLFAISALLPSWGDWILKKMTSK